MNSHNNYQQLTFNPKRQPRTDKHQRFAPHIKSNLNLHLNGQNEDLSQLLPFQSSDRIRHKMDQKQYQQQKLKIDSSYASQMSNYSSKNREQSSRRKEDEKKKQDILNRVKKLQDIVLPMVDREHNQQDLTEFGWQSKIQRKLIRIESSLDNARKEWQIGMEKKLIQLQNQWQNRMQEIISKYQ